MIANIDVTLRDGGYRNRFGFTQDYAVSHVRRLTECGIEWIEIGYRKGSFRPIPGIGLTGITDNDYIRTLRQAAPRAGLCVMAHPKNITHDDIVEMHEAGASMLRFCLNEEQTAKCFEYAAFARSLGMTVTVNIIRISYLTEAHIVRLAGMAERAGVDVLYVADSNGSLLPHAVGGLVRAIVAATGIRVGIHAHDNLGLAMPICDAAVEAGATFVDSSLRGMGKGAGNLKLELWLPYLMRLHPEHRYDLVPAFAQADVLEKTEAEGRPIHPLVDVVMGIHDLCVEDKKPLESPLLDGGLLFEQARLIHDAKFLQHAAE